MQTSINLVYSTDGGHIFSAPRNIGGNVLYSQGSRPVVGPDGTVYVFWDGSTRLATLDSTYMVKSTDGGVTWSAPAAIFPNLDSANRMPIGYDTLPAGVTLTPSTHSVDTFWPGVGVSPSGRVYMSDYAADVVSRWARKL